MTVPWDCDAWLWSRVRWDTFHLLVVTVISVQPNHSRCRRFPHAKGKVLRGEVQCFSLLSCHGIVIIFSKSTKLYFIWHSLMRWEMMDITYDLSHVALPPRAFMAFSFACVWERNSRNRSRPRQGFCKALYMHRMCWYTHRAFPYTLRVYILLTFSYSGCGCRKRLMTKRSLRNWICCIRSKECL